MFTTIAGSSSGNYHWIAKGEFHRAWDTNLLSSNLRKVNGDNPLSILGNMIAILFLLLTNTNQQTGL